MSGTETRARIVEAADALIYRCGFEHTSFAAIADAVQLSRGNFYYHFPTKDSILDAVIDARLVDTRDMLAQWEADAGGPADRIRRFIEIVVANRADIQDYGCPVGTLTAELAKLNHPARERATDVFTLFRAWLREQFTQLGHDAEADDLAMHVLASSQGIAAVANAFRDEAFIEREVEQLCRWLDSYASPAGRTGPDT